MLPRYATFSSRLHAGQIVALLREHAREVGLRSFVHGRLRRELRPGAAAVAAHQPVLAIGRPVVRDRVREFHRVIESPVEVIVKALDIDTDVAKQLPADFRIGRGHVDGLGAAVADAGAAADLELVALGMAAEIVVIVEHQDACVRPFRAVEVRGGEAADAAAHDDEVDSSSGALLGQLAPATRACIVSHAPSWLPRNPVLAGG